MPNVRLAVAYMLAVVGCSRAFQQPAAMAAPLASLPASAFARELSPQEQVAHVLSRLTFGARPGDAEYVMSIGVDRWIAEQLRPESIADTTLDNELRPFPNWTEPTSALPTLKMPCVSTFTLTDSTMRRDSSGKMVMASLSGHGTTKCEPIAASLFPPDQFFAGKVIRAQLSERQLLEVITDFWENHFSLFYGKTSSREALLVWDRDVIRPHALGKFRDLLGSVAHSPAMLYYLDNHLSAKNAINENYARELLELHTLGVDGGYTQQDVINVARALTGWTIYPKPRVPNDIGNYQFAFLAFMHDSSEKTVLGHTLAASRGKEDGEEVLDILARHPSTAHFISYKLARYLVSDDPPPALVNRATATFVRTDGDITEVVRTIVTSPEFFSRVAFRAKVKTPFELVVSTRRALSSPSDTTVGTERFLGRFGQAMFGKQTPDGWPDKGEAWVNSGTIKQRMVFAMNVASDSLAVLGAGAWRGWTLANEPASRQADGTIRLVLGGVAEPATREVMLTASGNGDARLRDMLALALASAEFQHR